MKKLIVLVSTRPYPGRECRSCAARARGRRGRPADLRRPSAEPGYPGRSDNPAEPAIRRRSRKPAIPPPRPPPGPCRRACRAGYPAEPARCRPW